MGEWGIPRDSVAGRQSFGKGLERCRRENLEQEFKALERGGCLGGEQFRQELLEQVSTAPGPSHFGAAVEVKAECLVVAALKQIGWREANLKESRKGDPRKVKLAQELRSKTTVPLAWIAQRLWMGSRGYLAWLLQRPRKGQPAKPSGQGLFKL
jgi:hypothetical protein